jgi:hypothetical protein
VLLALRLFWLTLFAAADHFQNGLAYPMLIVSALIGWRGWRPYWIAPLVVVEAIYAAQMYSHASGAGKLPGAMSNAFFQIGVFALLALIGLILGWAVRHYASRPKT